MQRGEIPVSQNWPRNDTAGGKRTSAGYNWIPRAHEERLTVAGGNLGEESLCGRTGAAESAASTHGTTNGANSRARVTLKAGDFEEGHGNQTERHVEAVSRAETTSVTREAPRWEARKRQKIAKEITKIVSNLMKTRNQQIQDTRQSPST